MNNIVSKTWLCKYLQLSSGEIWSNTVDSIIYMQLWHVRPDIGCTQMCPGGEQYYIIHFTHATPMLDTPNVFKDRWNNTYTVKLIKHFITYYRKGMIKVKTFSWQQAWKNPGNLVMVYTAQKRKIWKNLHATQDRKQYIQLIIYIIIYGSC